MKMNKLIFIPLAMSLIACSSIGNSSIASREDISSIAANDSYTSKASSDFSSLSETIASNVSEESKNVPSSLSSSSSVEVIGTGDYKINLDNIGTAEQYSYKNNVLQISKKGTYELTGTLNGALEVKKEIAGDVIIILNNASIIPTSTQDNPGICFKKLAEGDSYKRILSIKEGTINYVYNKAGDVSEQAAIISKSNLIIDGKGKLFVKAEGSESNGIQAKNVLTIQNTGIDVTATKNGIKGNYNFFIKNSSLNVNAGNDGIKTDVEASTTEEGNTYTKDPYAGYLKIENSSLDIISGDDGICANSYLDIQNNDSNLIKIKTNGGAPNTVTERGKDTVDGKAIKVCGISLVNSSGNETELKSATEYNYVLNIAGGKFEINSNSDAISSKGVCYVDGGDFYISTGDDGIRSDYITAVRGGKIYIDKCYEGIEGAKIEIHDGNITINSTDDGINAANSDLGRNYQFNIYIGGGNVNINAQGDGLDSNGSLEIAGGTVIINGPTGNDNGYLDADSGILINGGDVIALGSSGMVEIPGSNSKQYVIVFGANSTQAANTNISLADSSGKVLLETTSKKTFQAVTLSCAAITKGQTYKLTIGKTTTNITVNSIITKQGNIQTGPGGGGGPGGGPGGGGGWR